MARYMAKKLINSKKSIPKKDYLIEQLKLGNIPEEQIHNFFSFWDKE